MRVYKFNGYPDSWRVSGNMIAVMLEDKTDEVLPTIAEAMEEK
jgi:hypothetical protein